MWHSVYVQTFYASSAKADLRGYWCHPCYTETKSEYLDVEGQQVKKEFLDKRKNDEELDEGWVGCDWCYTWVHQICGLFNKGQNNSEVKYHCPHCLHEGMLYCGSNLCMCLSIDLPVIDGLTAGLLRLSTAEKLTSYFHIQQCLVLSSQNR